MIRTGSIRRRLAWACLILAAAPARGATQRFAVAKTYNNAPFEYSISTRPESETDRFAVYRVRFPSPVVTPIEANNTVSANYYLPKQLKSDQKYPAVVCLHILDGNAQLTELMCTTVARRGIPAISIDLPYYGPRRPGVGPEGLAENPDIFLSAISQAVEDIRRTVDLLCARPEVNPDRIGVMGISLGGIVGATAAAIEPRFDRANLILSGGELPTIIHHARETRQLSEMIRRLSAAKRAEVEAKLLALDPVHVAPALRDRARQGRVLMINVDQDEVIPPSCTQKLAEALGIADRVVWLKGLGHYTAVAELPRAMQMSGDFFAKGLDEAAPSQAAAAKPAAADRLVALLSQLAAFINTTPGEGRRHAVDLEIAGADAKGKPQSAQFHLVRSAGNRFALRCQLPVVGQVAVGQNAHPWMASGGKRVFLGTKNAQGGAGPLDHVDPQHLVHLRLISGIAGSIAMAPDLLKQWVEIEEDPTADGNAIRVVSKQPKKLPGELRIVFAQDGRAPESLRVSVAGVELKVLVRQWQIDAETDPAAFDPPADLPRQEVDRADLHRMFSAMANFAAERFEPARRADGPEALMLASRDPAGRGLLAHSQGKRILMVAGEPDEMGAAQGALVGPLARKLIERTVYLVGAADSLQSGVWFFDRMAEIERRTLPHIPPRFLVECDALSRALGVSTRDGRYANLFPERFHCSGAALRGKATQGGRVLHARVLDYMCDVDLQTAAVVQLFMPKGRHAWLSHGYAGFIGTVTAMNEKGLAIGEMGGRGEGLWDGMPMSLLLREVMERCATVVEAVERMRDAPRTCEYYYVLSDRSGAMVALECGPDKFVVLKPGQQHPELPHVPEDVVFVSGRDRAEVLSRRIVENYGKIDVPGLIEIIKRPVAMSSNLHDAIFAPETLEMWVSDAAMHGRSACDEPYARLQLRELLNWYAEQSAKKEK